MKQYHMKRLLIWSRFHFKSTEPRGCFMWVASCKWGLHSSNVNFLELILGSSCFDFQEEIRKLYGQLQQMKTANMEAGNRHLGRSASVMFSGSTPSLLNSTANNNGSLACLVNPGVREKRQQRYSPAAELVSDFVWRRFLEEGRAHKSERRWQTSQTICAYPHFLRLTLWLRISQSSLIILIVFSTITDWWTNEADVSVIIHSAP